MSDPSEDNLFATIKSTLLNDLIAEYQEEEGADESSPDWLNFDELEKELERTTSIFDGSAATGLNNSQSITAVSLLMGPGSGGAAGSSGTNVSTSTTPHDIMSGGQQKQPSQLEDAWSLALQKLSEAEQQDFLQSAESAKPITSPPPGLQNLPEYNIHEEPVAPRIGLTSPPPGLNKTTKTGSSGIQAKVPTTAKTPTRLPMTPQNSISGPGDATPTVPPTPPPSQQNTPMMRGQHPTMMMMMPPPVSMMGPPVTMPGMGVPPLLATPILAQPLIMPGGVAPTTPASVPPTAWGSPPPVPNTPANFNWAHSHQQQQQPVYCDPHGPPIPAARLASQHMNERDIGFVLHAILRPLLQRVDVDTCDYDERYWERRQGNITNKTKQFTPSKQMQKEMASREKVTKKWAEEHHTLGHVSKTNVTRPRALIAVRSETDDGDEGGSSALSSEQRQQRAALWKARVVCDQAYQAFNAAVDAWREAPPSNEAPTTPALRTSLARLGKCMGLKEEGKVSSEALDVLFKLPKGRTLAARVLEHALLPPSSVQILLPEILRCLYKSQSLEADNRLFGVLSHCFRGNLVSVSNLKHCLEVVLEYGVEALQTTSKMQCAHAMLQRGTRLSVEEPAFTDEWKRLEANFLALFSSM